MGVGVSSNLGRSRRIFRLIRPRPAEGVRRIVQVQEGAYRGSLCVRKLLYELCEYVWWERTRARPRERRATRR